MRAPPCPPLLESVLRLSKDGFPILTKRGNQKMGDSEPENILYSNTACGEVRLSEIVAQCPSTFIEMQMGIRDITAPLRVPMIA
jgi:hypothetical protein